MTVIEEIAAERDRQVSVEGWTPENDDGHDNGEMASAAACYATPGDCREGVYKGRIGHVSWSGGSPREWPLDIKWWKPTTARRDLIKAAALIVAEIERLDRAASATL